jgi:rubrerythrin
MNPSARFNKEFQGTNMPTFDSLSEKEVLALAIGMEEEDSRIYSDIEVALREDAPSTAEVFRRMRDEESSHRHRLIELFQKKFGDHIPLVRRDDVKGFIKRRPLWMIRPLGLDAIRKQANVIECEMQHFYEKAASRTQDAGVRQLLGDLAQEERVHGNLADALVTKNLGPGAQKEEEEAQRRLFILRVIQPGLAGLMDGSVSTLAPVFAAAFATGRSWDAFLVGMAASLGAGISMGFAEALSDDGSLTGRGHPFARGMICGAMTTLGGIGHTLPFMIVNFHIAMLVAMILVVIELGAIAYIRHRYMDTPWFSAAFQVVVGGVLVFITGILIGKFGGAAG